MPKPFLSLAAALLALASSGVLAQAYPNRPIRVIVPFPPGGAVDIVARTVSQKMGEQMGATFVVDNRAGANGTIGGDLVAKAAPDGYTLLVSASIHAINTLLLPKIPYDVERDFTAISNLGSVPLIVGAHPGVGAANLTEFLALARAAPQKYAMATSGLGSAGHLAIEMITREAKLNLLLVPYKGSAPALQDLAGGQVSVMADPFPSAYPLVRGGKVRPIAVTSPQRSPLLPDVPTVAEQGFRGFDMVSWYGLWGPAKLPAEIANRLTAEAAKAVRAPDVRERLNAQGFDPLGSSAQEFERYMRAEIAKYARVIKDANIKIEQ